MKGLFRATKPPFHLECLGIPGGRALLNKAWVQGVGALRSERLMHVGLRICCPVLKPHTKITNQNSPTLIHEAQESETPEHRTRHSESSHQTSPWQQSQLSGARQILKRPGLQRRAAERSLISLVWIQPGGVMQGAAMHQKPFLGAPRISQCVR